MFHASDFVALNKLVPHIKLIIPSMVGSALLVGCANTMPASGVNGGVGWPVQAYANACDVTLVPFEPICLTSGNVGVGYKYQGEFAACRQSMENYTAALDEYYRCSARKLKNIFDQLLTQVPKTYECYVGYFEMNSTGDPSSACPPVEVPTFFPSDEAQGLKGDLGVPLCVTKNKTFDFTPKRRYELDDCREQVDIFVGGRYSALSSHSVSALLPQSVSAQQQYDTYLRNLKWVLDRKAADAVSRFNSIADRQRVCY